MANSRKPARIDAVSLALAQWLTAQAPPLSASRLAIAFSGGRDSTILLHALAQQIAPMQLAALHIHHGLHPEADTWQQHCRDFCAQLGVPFFTCNIKVPRDSGLGTEAAARSVRYAALAQLALEAQCGVLLTAHHADDQVESILLQLLRGTGLSGAAGMAASKTALHSDLPQQRPLLEVPALAMAAYAAAQQLHWIEDPSNQNTHYTRNALRHAVLPVVQEYFPDYRNTLTRFAGHVAQAQELLNEFARLDYLQCGDGAGRLQTKRLLQLSLARQTNLLRYWLSLHQLAAPSEARLHEIMRRLQDTKRVRAWSILHDAQEIRFEYDALSLRAPESAPVNLLHSPTSIEFRWQGEASIAMPAWGGSWDFVAARGGVDADWLRQQSLSTRPRQSEAKLKLHPQRPSRSLKNLYQEAQIPHDQRARLPLLHAGGALLAVAGIGLDCRFIVTTERPSIQIVWRLE